jgi:hypothetical protein
MKVGGHVTGAILLSVQGKGSAVPLKMSKRTFGFAGHTVPYSINFQQAAGACYSKTAPRSQKPLALFRAYTTVSAILSP